MQLNRLLRPRSIAVLGGEQACEVIRQCLKMGYTGKIWPVHPHKKEIEGFPCFSSIDALPASPDATFIGVNREATVDIVYALSAMNAGGAVCYASGFRETDSVGEELERRLLQAAGSMPILGPNCYGLINYVDGALLWPDQHGGRRLIEGGKGVAIITQSSNVAINLTMQRRGLPLAYMLTVGNQVQVGLSQLAMAVLQEDSVTALGLHIEAFDSIAGMEALAMMSKHLNKPIVVMKVGKSEQSQEAAMTHTASLVGADANSHALLQRLGFGRVHRLASLIEALKLLHVHGTLAGYTMGAMCCSGGETSLIADAAYQRRVHFPRLSNEQKEPLEKVLGARVTVSNPLDYHTYIWGNYEGMRDTYYYMLAIDCEIVALVLDFPNIDCCQDDGWQLALMAFEAAVEVSSKKAALVASFPESLPEHYIHRLMQRGIVAIAGMESFIDACEVAADIDAAWRKRPAAPISVLPHHTDEIKSKSILLNEAQAKQYLKHYGVVVPEGHIVSSIEDAMEAAESIGFPLVLKRLGIAHKTELEAVCLNLKNSHAVKQAVVHLLSIPTISDTNNETTAFKGEVLVPDQSLYIESMVEDKVCELIVGTEQVVAADALMCVSSIWNDELKVGERIVYEK